MKSDVWNENLFMFYEQADGSNNLDYLKMVCDRLSLQLYCDDGKNRLNYIVSGNNFVIDVWYSRKDRELREGEEKNALEAQSMGSSVVAVKKEKPEEEVKGMEKISFSLVEDAWSIYFSSFVDSLWGCLVKKEYLRGYLLLKNLLIYDSDREENFAEVVKSIKEKEIEIRKRARKEADASFQVNYSIEHHCVCLVWRIEKPERDARNRESGVIVALVRSPSAEKVELCGRTYSFEEACRAVRILEQTKIMWKVVSECVCYNISVDMHFKKSEETLEHLEITGCIGGVEKTMSINDAGTFAVGKEIDPYRTLLLKRTESIRHVLINTEVEVVSR